jgi:hypothetical protein
MRCSLSSPGTTAFLVIPGRSPCVSRRAPLVSGSSWPPIRLRQTRVGVSSLACLLACSFACLLVLLAHIICHRRESVSAKRFVVCSFRTEMTGAHLPAALSGELWLRDAIIAVNDVSLSTSTDVRHERRLLFISPRHRHLCAPVVAVPSSETQRVVAPCAFTLFPFIGVPLLGLCS